MRFTRFFLFFVFLFLNSYGVDIATGPVATGSGNGSDWTNQALFKTVTKTRGNVYYLRDSDDLGIDYDPDDELDTANSGTTRIIVKKAIESDHGPSAGWNSAMGDGVAKFNEGFVIGSSYWTIDGQRGGGPGSWRTGHGIEVHPTDGAFGGILTQLDQSVNTHDLLIRHVAIIGPETEDNSDNGKPVALRIPNCHNSLFEYIYADRMGSNIIFGWGDDITFQYFFFGYFPSTDANHGETANVFGGNGTSNFTVRWGWIAHTEGTGGLIFGEADGVHIYGNVWKAVAGMHLEAGNGEIGAATDHTVTNLDVSNNTFIGPMGRVIGILQAMDDSGTFKNNYSYLVSDFGDISVLTSDYNHFADSGVGVGTHVTTSTGDPFIDQDNENFALTADTTPGVDLGAPYNVDMLGNTRTSWTRGAIQFTGSPSVKHANGATVINLNVGLTP